MVFEAKTYGTNLGYMKADQASTFGKTRYWRFLRTSASTRSCVGAQEGRGASVSAKTKPDAPAEAAKAN